MSLRERRFSRSWVWLLIGLCIGECLLSDMVLCLEADGRLMVEPAIEGKCRDLVQVVPAGEGVGAFISTLANCDLCLDLPLASGASYQLPRPMQNWVPLHKVSAMVVHPLLQPLAVTAIRITSFFPLLPVPSSALIGLRTTVLLI